MGSSLPPISFMSLRNKRVLCLVQRVPSGTLPAHVTERQNAQLLYVDRLVVFRCLLLAEISSYSRASGRTVPCQLSPYIIKVNIKEVGVGMGT